MSLGSEAAYLGTLLQITRKAKGYSLQQVAEVVGTSKGHLSDIEHAKTAPGFVLVARICACLEIRVQALANGVVALTGGVSQP